MLYVGLVFGFLVFRTGISWYRSGSVTLYTFPVLTISVRYYGVYYRYQLIFLQQQTILQTENLVSVNIAWYWYRRPVDTQFVRRILSTVPVKASLP